MPAIAVSVLAETAARFTARYPSADVDVHLSTDVVDLVKEGFDLALRISSGPLKDSTLVTRRLGSVVIALYASQAYLARKGAPRNPSDLDAHDWVAYRGLPPLILSGTERNRIKVRPRITCADMVFARAAIVHGGGIGALPMFLAEPELIAGRLVRILPRWVSRTGTVNLVRPGNKHVPRRVLAFTEVLTELLRQRPDITGETATVRRRA